MLMCTATPAAAAASLSLQFVVGWVSLLSALGNRWASTKSMEEINLNACEMQGKSHARAASAAAQEDERERERIPQFPIYFDCRCRDLHNSFLRPSLSTETEEAQNAPNRKRKSRLNFGGCFV
jgi:hypothetical protein